MTHETPDPHQQPAMEPDNLLGEFSQSSEASVAEINKEFDDFVQGLRDIEPTYEEMKAADSRITPGSHSQEDEGIVRRYMRVNTALADSELLATPFMSDNIRKGILERYKKYVDGDATCQELNKVLEPALSAILTTRAVKVMLGAEDDSDVSVQQLEDFRIRNPEVFHKLEEFGQASSLFFAEGLSTVDHSVDIQPGSASLPPRSLKWEFIGKDGIRQLIGPELQPFQLDHITKMTALAATNGGKIEKGFFHFYPPEHTNTNDPGKFGVKALFRRINGLRQERIPAEKNFKLHVMPKSDQIADTAAELISMLETNSGLRDAIHSFKIQATISKDEQMGENPTPDIVVYPRHDVRSVAQTLHELRKHFAGREGRGLIPRFNIPIAESTMLYMAEGHGHEKKDAFDRDKALLAAMYDPSQNYAFSRQDRGLVEKILQTADSL
jgi:hypothetical protein